MCRYACALGIVSPRSSRVPTSLNFTLSGFSWMNGTGGSQGLVSFAAQGQQYRQRAAPQNQSMHASGGNSALGQRSALPQTQSMHSNTGSSSPAQASAVQGALPVLFQSCQARMSLHDQLEMDPRSVKRLELLGRGSYAEVFKGHALGTECAIKLFKKTTSARHIKEAWREIRIAASLDHPGTVRLLGWTREPLQTIMELCCGDLTDFYQNKIESLPYSEREVLRLLRVSFERWSILVKRGKECSGLEKETSPHPPSPIRRAPLGSSTSTLSASYTATSNQATF